MKGNCGRKYELILWKSSTGLEEFLCCFWDCSLKGMEGHCVPRLEGIARPCVRQIVSSNFVVGRVFWWHFSPSCPISRNLGRKTVPHFSKHWREKLWSKRGVCRVSTQQGIKADLFRLGKIKAGDSSQKKPPRNVTLCYRCANSIILTSLSAASPGQSKGGWGDVLCQWGGWCALRETLRFVGWGVLTEKLVQSGERGGRDLLKMQPHVRIFR